MFVICYVNPGSLPLETKYILFNINNSKQIITPLRGPTGMCVFANTSRQTPIAGRAWGPVATHRLTHKINYDNAFLYPFVTVMNGCL